MHRNYVLYCFVVHLTCCLDDIVARQAIVGGEIVQHDFRYQATILIADETLRCGGGIIEERIIITAAHCVLDTNAEVINKSISVLVGTYNLLVAGTVVRTEEIFIPKECNPHTPHCVGDIAVLGLEKPLELRARALKMLRLARLIQHNKKARIAGFGWDTVFENNELIGLYSDHRLRYTEAIILNESECKRDHPKLNLTERHVCARAKGKRAGRHGVCIGDGGGPLVFQGSIVIGVLSVSTLGCNESMNSGIYTSVVHYLNFINFAKENVVDPNGRVFQV